MLLLLINIVILIMIILLIIIYSIYNSSNHSNLYISTQYIYIYTPYNIQADVHVHHVFLQQKDDAVTCQVVSQWACALMCASRATQGCCSYQGASWAIWAVKHSCVYWLWNRGLTGIQHDLTFNYSCSIIFMEHMRISLTNDDWLVMT